MYIILKLPILDPASHLSISFCRRWSNCGATKKNNDQYLHPYSDNSVHFTPAAQNEKTMVSKHFQTFLNIASIDHLCFLTILKIVTIPVDPSTFLGSVWDMIWGVFCTFSGGVWIHREDYHKERKSLGGATCRYAAWRANAA